MAKIENSGVLALSALVFATAPAYADGNFYLGAGIGETDIEDACDELGGVGLTGSCDDRGTGWKLFGGYRFTQQLGVEAFYADLGEASGRGTVGAVPATADAEADGFGVAGVAMLPVGEQFTFFGKVGVFSWDVEGSATVGGVSGSQDDDGTSVMGGAGIQYSFTDQFSARIEWERFAEVGDDNTTGESDIDLVSAGVVFSF